MGAVKMNRITLGRSVIAFCVTFFLGCLCLILRSDGRKEREMENDSKVSPTDQVFPMSDEPLSADFPHGTKIVLDEPDAKGWKQTGKFPLDFDDAEAVVAEIMKRRGFKLKHREFKDGDVRRSLAQWSTASAGILWSIWETDSHETGFSWGVSK